jgi:L-rhamnose mutarotase
LEVEDHAAMIAELERLPVDIAWQARTADLLDVVHDYSAEGSGAGLPVAWEL